MTAVFSRTVILQLNLPTASAQMPPLPKDLQLEVLVRPNLLEVADRNTGPLKDIPNTAAGYDYDGLTDFLKRVKAQFPGQDRCVGTLGKGHLVRHAGAGDGSRARV